MAGRSGFPGWRYSLGGSGLVSLPILLSLILGAPSPAAGQQRGGWNDARTLALVRQAIERRTVEAVDTGLVTYAADARGFVYFLLDAPEAGRRSLVRTDQVALEVYWQAPNQVRQRIVGWRERNDLPVRRLYYYLDRLTVVQDNYGDGIVIADGDNVNDVPHPVAPGAEAIYDYRMVDSLTLRLPGAPEPVRVRELQVRPRDANLPAIVGSIFVEAGTGALVRLSFTFTPSAYVDPRLDFINVTLENGLWQGRFWLPHEQSLEIRREMPELDLPFGTIIRTRMRIGNYRFNQELPGRLFADGITLSAVPRAEREAFPFEQPITAEWRLEGIGPPPAIGELRREARALVRERALSGLPRARPGVEAASDVFRYNRAEGAVLGIGAAARPSADVGIRIHGAWAFGPDHPVIRAQLAAGDAGRVTLSGYLNRAGDAGGFAAASRLANTLGSLVVASDATDPYHASGGSLSVRQPLPGAWSLVGDARLERQRSATLAGDFSLFGDAADFRPVRPIDPGDRFSAGIALRRDIPAAAGGSWGGVRLENARLNGPDGAADFTRVRFDAGGLWTAAERSAEVEVTASAGGAFGELPRQELFRLGGRGTLPGYPFRTFGGDRFLLGSARASVEIVHPWLRGRAFGAVAWTGAAGHAHRTLGVWGATPTGGPRPAVGIGAGLFYDLIHLDFARGLGPGGHFQLIAEFQPEFWGWL